jgi:hypothetical protein
MDSETQGNFRRVLASLLLDRLPQCSLGVLLAIAANAAPPFSVEEDAKLLASDTATERRFGLDVALDRDTAVVVSTFTGNKEVRAYVFLRKHGAWVEQQNFFPSDPALLHGQCCSSVALDGRTLMLGASNFGQATGAVYVFVRKHGTWVERQRLLASDPETFRTFGDAIALDGDVAIIGASGDGVEGTDSGAVYVFVRKRGRWTERQKLVPSDADSLATASFGSSVALQGRTAVIVARSGSAAYVFERRGRFWIERQKLVTANGLLSSVALDRRTLVIGAPFDDSVGVNTGAAYVYRRREGMWEEWQNLYASDPTDEQRIANRVALQRNVIILGAPSDNEAGLSAGAAYIFVRNQGVWAEQRKLSASDAAVQDRFGVSLALDRNTAVIGAFLDDVNGQVNAGSAYVFSLGPAANNRQ